jgi:hypothetical protein
VAITTCIAYIALFLVGSTFNRQLAPAADDLPRGFSTPQLAHSVPDMQDTLIVLVHASLTLLYF